LAAAGTWFGTHLLVRRRLDALVTAARELGDVEIQKTRSAAPELAKIPVGQYGEVVDEMWSSLQRVATRQADIAAMIAHDLRNPIQTTGLAAAMLLQSGERLTEEQQSLVKGIQASCDELARIIKDFMDFSKFRAGYLELDREEVDVPVLLQRTQQKYSPLARKRQLNLKTHVEFGIGTAYVDQQKMEQLIGNLISNAVKFTPTGGEIELGARKTNGGVEIWVGDTGMGIEHGELQQLFAKYQQTSSARKSSEEGTGLGLLICRMIAEGHGGRIWVDSEVNQRTIFHVWLPTQEEEIYLAAGTA